MTVIDTTTTTHTIIIIPTITTIGIAQALTIEDLSVLKDCSAHNCYSQTAALEAARVCF